MINQVGSLVKVVGVRFKKAGKIYYFDPGELDLSPGDRVIVDTNRGLEYGEVAIRTKLVPDDAVVLPLRKVIREAGEDDLRLLQSYKARERDAFAVAVHKIDRLQLPMRLVAVEYTFDGAKMVFYFVAEERVDFRDLVKDLAGHFRCRIELRQIGPRDQAKVVGGIGDCGRELCCSTWLGEFEPISIRMAKDQNLTLNPSRLSGQCGRLKCCLRYEVDQYREIQAELPKFGQFVRTPAGTGRVVEVQIIRERVLVDLGENRRIAVTSQQLRDGEAAVVAGDAADRPPERAPAPSRNGAGKPSASSGFHDDGEGSGEVAAAWSDGSAKSAAAPEAGPQGSGPAKSPRPRRRRRRRRSGPKGDGSNSKPPEPPTA